MFISLDAYCLPEAARMGLSGILYSCVARSQVILAENLTSGVQGNASVVALQILGKLSASNGDRLSYLVGDQVYSVLVSDGIYFLCMTEQVIFHKIHNSLHISPL